MRSTTPISPTTRVRGFIAEANPAALREIAERFSEAIERGLWRPASNSAHRRLEELRAGDSALSHEVRFAARGVLAWP